MQSRKSDVQLDETIVQRFERIAASFPDNIAIDETNVISQSATSSTRCSYRQLNQRANGIARAIANRVATSNEPVALLLQQDANAFTAILGALKARKIVVPLDATHPLERLRFMLDDTRAPLLVTDRTNEQKAREMSKNRCELLNIDDLYFDLNNENLDATELAIVPDARATLIYTSGSTGAPKGVLQTHRNVVHHVESYAAQLGFCERDRFALLGSYGFGQGIKTVFAALLNGAALCPFDLKNHGADELARWLIKQKITVLICVPSVFRHLARESSTRFQFPDLRMIRLGGDALRANDVALFRARFDENCQLVNSFSSTESGNATLFFLDHTTPISGDEVPVGWSHGETAISVLDEQGSALAPNCIGEIAVRSRFLSPGYWRRDDLTAQKFSVCENAERLYRTGDRGFLDENGCLHHRGRLDFQVKIRGFRIEPGEIESALRTCDAIEEVVVACDDDLGESSGEKKLVAYYTAKNNCFVDDAELRGFLCEKLPSHLIPAVFAQLETLPQNANGKIDRARLPPLVANRLAANRVLDIDETPHDKPLSELTQSELENRLAEIWRAVLKLGKIGRDDNFFASGGHSLLAGVLLARINAGFDQTLRLSSLFAHATIARQAALLRAENESTANCIIALQPHGSRPPLFVLHDLADGFLNCHGFLHGLGRDQPLFGVQPAREQWSDEARVFETMASRYARAIIAFQPQGALYLCGYSFAGSLAFEVARQLELQGRHVAFLALLDTSCRADPTHSRDTTTRRQRQRNHRHIWRHLRPRDRCIYLAHYTQKRLESHVERIKKIGKMWAKADAPTDHDEVALALTERIRVNREASAAYRVEFFDGHLTLIRAMLSYRDERDLDLGWKQFARSLEIVEVSGNHGTMLLPPHMHLLARRFTRSLRRAQNENSE